MYYDDLSQLLDYAQPQQQRQPNMLQQWQANQPIQGLHGRRLPTDPSMAGPLPQNIQPQSLMPFLPPPSTFPGSTPNTSQTYQLPLASMTPNAVAPTPNSQQPQVGPINKGNFYQSGQQPSGGEYWQNLDTKPPLMSQEALANVISGNSGGIDQSVNGSYNEQSASGGLNGAQGSPYAVLDNYMSRDPVHTLGVNGFRTGASAPSVDNSGMVQRQMAIRNNMQIGDMLNHQDIARQKSANDILKTMLMANERGDSSRDRETNKFWGILEKTPEGMRTPLIEQGVQQGHVTKDVGQGMLLNEMMKRAMMGAKDKSGVVDIGKLLGSLQSEFDPNKLSRSELIKRIQMAGITPDQIYEKSFDPSIGKFAKSLLGQESQGPESMMHWLLR